MTSEQKYISYAILKDLHACSESLKSFKKNYGTKEYTVFGILKFTRKHNIVNSFMDVLWLIRNCEYCQTPAMLKYYKSLNPSYEDVSCLIRLCEYCQTPEMEAYMDSLG